MLMPAECPHCSHSYQIDSGFLGCVRKCPECGEKFTFENSSEEGGETAGPLRLACPECLREFIVKDIFREANQIPCSFCSCMMSKEEGQRTLELASQAETLCKEAMLRGELPEQVLEQVIRLGVLDTAAEQYITNELRRLPFHRHQFSIDEKKGKPIPPGTCDLCGTPLSAQLQTSCHIVRWHCPHSPDDNDDDRIPIFFRSGGYLLAKMIMKGLSHVFARAFGSRLRDNEMSAIYFLCKGCEGSVKAKLFGRYQGYPADSGYSVVSYENRPV